jgi:hypothetical protein
MVKYAGFQPRPVRRRFGAFLPVFAIFFCFLCALRADIVYLDEAGNVISSEKTEYDKNGNIIVVPAEEAKEEIVTPGRGAEEEIVSADGENLDLSYGGISVVSDGGVKKVVFRLAPPNAVRLVIPDGVTDIDSGAFRQCKNLESVVFPNSVNFIPGGAFSYSENQKLKSVILPVHASIGPNAFHALHSLESVTLNRDGKTAAPPPEDAAIGADAFGWCRNLKQFEFPEGIRSIGKYAFINCDMESVTVPDGVETIGEWAFCQCAALKTVRLPDSLKTIGKWAFCNCIALADLKLPSGPVDLGERAFESCFALKHFKFPPIMSAELPSALYNCRGLETVEFPTGITSIGENAFDSCHKLKEIAIPDGVRTIKFRAFAGCPKLERVILPASLKKLESSAFGWCPELKEITIPEGMKQIAADAFRDTPCWNSVCKQAETHKIKIKYGP